MAASATSSIAALAASLDLDMDIHMATNEVNQQPSNSNQDDSALDFDLDFIMDSSSSSAVATTQGGGGQPSAAANSSTAGSSSLVALNASQIDMDTSAIVLAMTPQTPTIDHPFAGLQKTVVPSSPAVNSTPTLTQYSPAMYPMAWSTPAVATQSFNSPLTSFNIPVVPLFNDPPSNTNNSSSNVQNGFYNSESLLANTPSMNHLPHLLSHTSLMAPTPAMGVLDSLTGGQTVHAAMLPNIFGEDPPLEAASTAPTAADMAAPAAMAAVSSEMMMMYPMPTAPPTPLRGRKSKDPLKALTGRGSLKKAVGTRGKLAKSATTIAATSSAHPSDLSSLLNAVDPPLPTNSVVPGKRQPHPLSHSTTLADSTESLISTTPTYPTTDDPHHPTEDEDEDSNAEPQIHTCTHPGCTKTFPRLSALRSHIASHSTARPHECKTCGARFVRGHDLFRHERTVHHGGKKPFTCPGCHREFSRSDALKKHMTVDLDEGPKTGKGKDAGREIKRRKKRRECVYLFAAQQQQQQQQLEGGQMFGE
ncbi:hypothetical protein HDV05_002069 [Chytridiales sp. JEL 0842]|nr:hypothetical protein HDV05_002069 [Chytridiales sp. JEL 0842]